MGVICATRIIWIRGTMPPKRPSARYVQKPSPGAFPKKNEICMKVQHGKSIEIPWNTVSELTSEHIWSNLKLVPSNQGPLAIRNPRTAWKKYQSLDVDCHWLSLDLKDRERPVNVNSNASFSNQRQVSQLAGRRKTHWQPKLLWDRYLKSSQALDII